MGFSKKIGPGFWQNVNKQLTTYLYENQSLLYNIEILIIWISRIQNTWIYCSTRGSITYLLIQQIYQIVDKTVRFFWVPKPTPLSPRSYYQYCVFIIGSTKARLLINHQAELLCYQFIPLLYLTVGRVPGNSHEYSRARNLSVF